MLRDVPITRKDSDLPCRWSSDDYFDLIVWYEKDASVHGFQLCYDKQGNERALTWTRERGFSHREIDGGEETPMRNRSPIMGDRVEFRTEPVVQEFRQRSRELCERVRVLVLEKLLEAAEALSKNNRAPHQTVAPKPKA